MRSDTSMAPASGRTWRDRIHTQRNRRILAALYVANLVAMLLATWLVDSYWVALPFGALWVALMVLTTLSIRGITNEGSVALDEQQIAFRNAGYKDAYWIGVGVAFVGGVLMSALSDSDTVFEVGLFIGAWGIVTGLPTLIVAWTLPPEVDDEQ